MLVLSSGSGLDIAGELGAVLGSGFEVSLVRAANRQTVELVLDGAVQFGIVHILAHGSTSVLDFGDERMSEAELVSLISAQKALQFVVLACCNGYETAGGIHNALHVPVVAYNAPIEDRAAVEFARGFYRSWRRDQNVGQAVDRGREALAVLFPTEAGKVRLLNGDMVTPSAFGACMGKIDARLDQLGGDVAGINQRLDRMDQYPRRWLYVGLLLGLLLIAAQLGTPFLNAAMIPLGGQLSPSVVWRTLGGTERGRCCSNSPNLYFPLTSPCVADKWYRPEVRCGW